METNTLNLKTISTTTKPEVVKLSTRNVAYLTLNPKPLRLSGPNPHAPTFAKPSTAETEALSPATDIIFKGVYKGSIIGFYKGLV